MKVSVLYVTKRPGGMDVLRGNLQRQTFRDYEVVIVDAFDRDLTVLTLFMNGLGPHLRHFFKPNLPLWGALNAGLTFCAGELIVFLQDYIWIRPNGISRFVLGQDARPGLYTGVGNVGEGPEKVCEDELTIFGAPYYGPPERIRWEDPRLGAWDGRIVQIPPDQWENNWACAPRDLLLELGGFDEEFDKGWGYAEKELAARAHAIGVRCYMDTGNRCMAWYHDDWWPNELKSKAAENEMRYNTCIAELQAGWRAPRLPFGGAQWATRSTPSVTNSQT